MLKPAILTEQRVILAGKLAELRPSERTFMLDLEDGSSLLGILSGPYLDFSELGSLLGARVRIEGIAKFGLSGEVLRVETDRIAGASGDIAVWSHAPKPVFAPLDDRTLRVAQGPAAGVSAIFGQWPGDESDEEFQEAIGKLL